MATNAPTYEVHDVVYFRESAAIGHLEAVRISGITRFNDTWLYAIQPSATMPTSVAQYGDRITAVQSKTLYFTESELITHCDALALAIANTERNLARLQAQQSVLCPSTAP